MKILTKRWALLAVWLLSMATGVKAQTFEVDGIRYSTDNMPGGEVEVVSNGYEGDVIIPSTVSYEEENYTVTSIGGYSFYDCKDLTSIDLPSTLTSIGEHAFGYCTGLTYIEIPSTLTNIGYYAFENCIGLTSIEIPASVTSLGKMMFFGCTNLQYIDVEAGNMNYCAIDGLVYDKNVTTLYIVPCGSTHVELPSTVTSIGNSAFSDCTGLTSIEIPASVTSIGSYAFEGCTGLTSIEIPASVTSIGYEAFALCTGLTAIEIPASVTSIGGYAFAYCTDLTSVELPSALTSIEDDIFLFCTGLASIKIPASVTSIGERAFVGCTGLTSIEIPASVTSIGENAFNGCTGLTSIELPSALTSIAYGVFTDCDGLVSIEIPASVTSIGSYAFEGCTGLTSIEIPASVTSIGSYAFAGCTGLTSIKIPASVTSIGSYAFGGCTGLTSVNIPSAVTSIGDGAFYVCSGLTTLVIPASVTQMGSDVVGRCEQLQIVVCLSSNEEVISNLSASVASSETTFKVEIYSTQEILDKIAIDGATEVCLFNANGVRLKPQGLSFSLTDVADILQIKALEIDGQRLESNADHAYSFEELSPQGKYALTVYADINGVEYPIPLAVALERKNLEFHETDAHNSVGDFTYANVELHRTLEADGWNTFCVPFGMTVEQARENHITAVRKLSGIRMENGNAVLETEPVCATPDYWMKAGVPYLVKANAGYDGILHVADVMVSPEMPSTLSVGTGVTMTGCYESMRMPDGGYFISKNAFYRADVSTGVLNGFRAYVELSSDSPADGADRLFIDIDGTAVKIEGIRGVGNPDKPVDVVASDGVTVKAGVRKSRALDGLQPGLYIVDGRKYVVK